ncbi:hypothetical protein BO86DRAFT_47631 [Aspergillus japonicus CBS 114.51]|uniref:Uncharacterized protein n=2 Tax=Aspergillus TaxID=5052 RepID=A0A2V5ITV1_ASPV1|nr:hypothetical protein BO86DRAFT_47631 [Aspergillus japonicus CBS 114.51]PYI23386.1 hypothetical protein BO99DRAFT_203986 [Aspergillus violaceofuscus CBS 115571]RAH83357.1 hypothetical protein BO86DRAFT_47631 [Aspergillus japonicus CBS 114.51]
MVEPEERAVEDPLVSPEILHHHWYQVNPSDWLVKGGGRDLMYCTVWTDRNAPLVYTIQYRLRRVAVTTVNICENLWIDYIVGAAREGGASPSPYTQHSSKFLYFFCWVLENPCFHCTVFLCVCWLPCYLPCYHVGEVYATWQSYGRITYPLWAPPKNKPLNLYDSRLP